MTKIPLNTIDINELILQLFVINELRNFQSHPKN